jgi:nitroreductase
MDFYETIEKRRTYRVFKKGATEEELRKIILAGTKAPSAGNRQSWEFIVVDDPKIIEELGEIKYQQNRKYSAGPGQTQKDIEDGALNQKKWYQNASVVAVCTKSGDAGTGWLAVENMSLAAAAEGLGSNIISYWSQGQKEAEKVLGLPEGYELTCVLKIGVPAGEVPPPKKRAEFSWLRRNKF